MRESWGGIDDVEPDEFCDSPVINCGQALILRGCVDLWEGDFLAEWVLGPREFHDVVVGDFLQVLAVCMNWCGLDSMGSLLLSPPTRWQGCRNP